MNVLTACQAEPGLQAGGLKIAPIRPAKAGAAESPKEKTPLFRHVQAFREELAKAAKLKTAVQRQAAHDRALKRLDAELAKIKGPLRFTISDVRPSPSNQAGGPKLYEVYVSALEGFDLAGGQFRLPRWIAWQPAADAVSDPELAAPGDILEVSGKLRAGTDTWARQNAVVAVDFRLAPDSLGLAIATEPITHPHQVFVEKVTKIALQPAKK